MSGRNPYSGQSNSLGPLFDLPSKQLARKTDTPSSHRAAETITRIAAASQRERVLRLVEALPGLTSAELAQRSGLDRHMVARRLADLKNLGLVTQQKNGSQDVTWRVRE